MKKFAVLVLLVLLSVVAAPGPVQANSPEHGERDAEEDFFVVDCVPYGYDFDLWVDSAYHLSWTYREYEDGYWTQEEHVTGVVRLYNKRHPDLAISGPFYLNNHIERYTGPLCPTDWPCMIRNVTGMMLQLKLPGQGVVDHQTGLSTDVRYWPEGPYTGPEVYWGELKRAGLDKYDDAAFCAALSQ